VSKLFLISIVAFPFFVFAQKSKSFYDDFGLQGKVTYSGTWRDSSLPENGRYELSWRTLNSGNVKTYKASGNLNKGLLQGKWLWEEAAWTYSIQTGKTLTPDFKLSGLRYAWNASFKDGKAHGNWNFTLDSVPATEKFRTEKVQIQASYESALPIGKFTIFDSRTTNSFTATGECNKKGIAIGTWVFETVTGNNHIVETRKYEEGILTELISTTFTEVDTISQEIIWNDRKEMLEKIKKGKSPLPFCIGEANFQTDGSETPVKEIFVSYFDSLLLKKWNLSVFNASYEVSQPSFKKIQYPFTNEEKIALEQSVTMNKNILHESEWRLQYQNLELNRSRTVTLNKAVAYTEAIHAKALLLDSLLREAGSEFFTYQNRKNEFEKVWGALINSNNSHTNSAGETTLVLPVFNVSKNTKGLLKELHEHTGQLQTLLIPHLNEIDVAYQKFQKEGELLKLENIISNKVHLLDSCYSKQSVTGEWVKMNWVNGYVRSLFKEYSNTEDFTMAKDKAKDIIRKSDTLILWHNHWKRIDSMAIYLKEYYTVFEYNPYNGKHDIEIRKKRKFYNKVNSVLWPWLIQELQKGESWFDWTSLKSSTEEVFVYLKHFANDDSKTSRKLEDKVKKEKSPEKILKILLNHS